MKVQQVRAIQTLYFDDGGNMKIREFIYVGILLLGSAAGISAQNSSSISHDDACWASLEALRTCELAQEKLAIEQAERCTSYPEYQCMPAAGQYDAETRKKASKGDHVVKNREAGASASVIHAGESSWQPGRSLRQGSN
jgi:hypothetical protein